MVLLLFILIPLLTGIISFAFKGNMAKGWALFSSVATLAAVVFAASFTGPDTRHFMQPWLPALGATFSLKADGMALMLCLLTAIVYPVIMLVSWNKVIERPAAFYGLLLLAQAGLMGVFLASDALLFYFCWELALIPVYFLCSRWGGEKRIQVTFKFFVYTFVGSLMMLAGLIYIYLQTPNHSYAWVDIVTTGSNLPHLTQLWLFWLLFIAFAIKMPVFPFHTWQPDTYQQSPTPVTIVLSALMVKMGIYAVVRWLLPVLPEGVSYWSETVTMLSIVGIIYASCLAMVQTDLKRLVAYSSIAHMGLMCAAAFSGTQQGMHGLMVQMFNHGINVCGMWLIVQLIENRYGTRDMTKLGGMSTAMPWMAISLLIISFANIALPLTNGFIGEFMLFNGLFQSRSTYHIIFMVVAGLGIILGAVYTLSMVQKVAFGNEAAIILKKDVMDSEFIGIVIILALIIFLGVYPKPLLDLTAGFANI